MNRETSSVRPFDGLEPTRDPSPADWLVESLRRWEGGRTLVGSVVPDGYAAYGRIFHPTRRSDKPGKVRWADIAAERGSSLTPEVRFNALIDWVPARDGQDPPEPYKAPWRGTLQADECARLATIVARFTQTPTKIWFCLWEGYGWPELPRPGEGPPRVKMPSFDCLLFSGPSSSATAFRSPPWFQSPTVWWPSDRAWCVVSPVDLYSTYIGCSEACISALLRDPGLEVVRTAVGHRLDPSPFVPNS
jgi:hypothetical protein